MNSWPDLRRDYGIILHAGCQKLRPVGPRVLWENTADEKQTRAAHSSHERGSQGTKFYLLPREGNKAWRLAAAVGRAGHSKKRRPFGRPRSPKSSARSGTAGRWRRAG